MSELSSSGASGLDASVQDLLYFRKSLFEIAQNNAGADFVHE